MSVGVERSSIAASSFHLAGTRVEFAARAFGPFAAQAIDRLDQRRLIHHQHAQCYTCPRRWRGYGSSRGHPVVSSATVTSRQ